MTAGFLLCLVSVSMFPFAQGRVHFALKKNEVCQRRGKACEHQTWSNKIEQAGKWFYIYIMLNAYIRVYILYIYIFYSTSGANARGVVGGLRFFYLMSKVLMGHFTNPWKGNICSWKHWWNLPLHICSFSCTCSLEANPNNYIPRRLWLQPENGLFHLWNLLTMIQECQKQVQGFISLTFHQWMCCWWSSTMSNSTLKLT